MNVSEMTHVSKPKIYIRGINKKVNRDSLLEHFGKVGSIQQLHWTDGTCDKKREGFCWIDYGCIESAERAVAELHNSTLQGTTMSVKFDIRRDEMGQSSHMAHVSRYVRTIDGVESDIKRRKLSYTPTVDYTTTGVSVNGVEYPTPQGWYLMKLLKLQSSFQVNPAAADLMVAMNYLISSGHGNKQAKELSESMAMANGLWTLGQMSNTNWEKITNATVYVIGDGCIPQTAITLMLFFPRTWNFISIDPLMCFDTSVLGPISSRLTVFNCKSEEFVISDPYSQSCSTSEASSILPGSPTEGPHTSVIIACHSHAPLQEFWARVPSPKFGVTLPCCGKTWSTLEDRPIHEYEDYEVFSPKRRVYLYHSKSQATTSNTSSSTCISCSSGII